MKLREAFLYVKAMRSKTIEGRQRILNKLHTKPLKRKRRRRDAIEIIAYRDQLKDIDPGSNF